MADTTATDTDHSPPGRKKRGILPILLALGGAGILGGAGFYATYAGLILSPAASHDTAPAAPPDFAFVAVDQITVSLLPGSGARHLRFSAQIEVAAQSVALVEQMRPRLLDMMNLYLRAVEPTDLADPAALVRLRAQLLRRVQLMVGDDHVRDILITEFVLS